MKEFSYETPLKTVLLNKTKNVTKITNSGIINVLKQLTERNGTHDCSSRK
jgi:hypothetical protein